MNLFRLWASRAIKIDFESEISYGQDQAYISYPVVFPTVSFELLPTDFLCEAARTKIGGGK